MIVQAFVPDWPGKKQHAAETAELLAPHCDSVEVLSNPDHFYSEQFREMRARFTGDILLSVVADVWPPKDLAGMVARGAELLSGNEVGIYAPDVYWTGQKMFRHKTPQLFPGVHDVPAPEMLCWMIRRDVLEAMPEIDPAVNKFGWGIEYVAVAAARALGRRTVRDYNFQASHPRGINYNNDEATRHFWAMVDALPGEWPNRVREVYEERQRVGVRLTALVIGPDHVADGVENKLRATGLDEVRRHVRLTGNWRALLADVQDAYYLGDVLPEDFIDACRESGVNNLWFLIPRDSDTWGGPNAWHWRHPHYVANLTTHMDLQVAWLLPQALERKP